MNGWVLLVTHAASFVAGGIAVKAWITRKVRVRDVDGHVTLEYRPHTPHGTTDQQ